MAAAPTPATSAAEQTIKDFIMEILPLPSLIPDDKLERLTVDQTLIRVKAMIVTAQLDMYT
jgi:hypothetical protein